MNDPLELCSSRAMQSVRELIAKIAGTDVTVLLRGESGVGKEVVARAIHNTSPRANRLLLKINCAAMPGELLESELFGHQKGAFTGAYRDKPGKFEVAHGGTLMLDEIGEMPLSLQAKLLHVLQDGESARVGAPPRIEISRPRSGPASSAKTSITGSTSSRCASRRSASAAKRSPPWSAT